MRLVRLTARSFKSLHDVQVEFSNVNVFVGANAAGKSNILDALSFLQAGVRDRSFDNALFHSGGVIHLAWKGAPAGPITLEAEFREETPDSRGFSWVVSIRRAGQFGAVVDERLDIQGVDRREETILNVADGVGFWLDPETGHQVHLKLLGSTVCALAAAANLKTFEGRGVADFVRGWGFFDPNPALLRRPSDVDAGDALERFGQNLAARLRSLDSARFDEIVAAARSILGVPESIDFREPRADDDERADRVYLVFKEAGLQYVVHQVGASTGTLRMLALLTALLGDDDATLIGIEEPENHIHPSALADFAQYLLRAGETKQIAVTTHAPLLVGCLGDPRMVQIVRRTDDGTTVTQEDHPEAVERALKESGLSLGQYLQSTGFGAS